MLVVTSIRLGTVKFLKKKSRNLKTLFLFFYLLRDMWVTIERQICKWVKIWRLYTLSYFFIFKEKVGNPKKKKWRELTSGPLKNRSCKQCKPTFHCGRRRLQWRRRPDSPLWRGSSYNLETWVVAPPGAHTGRPAVDGTGQPYSPPQRWAHVTQGQSLSAPWSSPLQPERKTSVIHNICIKSKSLIMWLFKTK